MSPERTDIAARILATLIVAVAAAAFLTLVGWYVTSIVWVKP